MRRQSLPHSEGHIFSYRCRAAFRWFDVGSPRSPRRLGGRKGHVASLPVRTVCPLSPRGRKWGENRQWMDKMREVPQRSSGRGTRLRKQRSGRRSTRGPNSICGPILLRTKDDHKILKTLTVYPSAVIKSRGESPKPVESDPKFIPIRSNVAIVYARTGRLG